MKYYPTKNYGFWDPKGEMTVKQLSAKNYGYENSIKYRTFVKCIWLMESRKIKMFSCVGVTANEITC